MSSFIKIRPVGAEFFHADRRTDMTKLIVGFRNFFANGRKNAFLYILRSAIPCVSLKMSSRKKYDNLITNVRKFFENNMF